MQSVVVAAPSQLAADMGAAVADAGGSAVDALIAATLTAMCSEPGVCAPGGGGFVTVAPGRGRPISIDGSMAMPGIDLPADRPLRSRPVAMEYGGGITTEVGPASIAVPGAFAAFGAAHRRWGRMPWHEVVSPVADRMRAGFPLSAACRYYLEHSGEAVFGVDPASRAALFDGDRLRDESETVVVADLADTLEHIAAEGPATFYTGELARRVVADLAERGSRLTLADLARYRPLVEPALTTLLGGWEVATTPPPALGGVAVSALLRLLWHEGDPRQPEAWARAHERVLRDRSRRLGSGGDRSRAGWEMLSGYPSGGAGSTVSISVAGTDGLVAAATMSGGYGSGVIPAGTGLWMNNSLGEHELNPGGPEATPVGAHLLSNMAPTTATSPGRRLALGSPGAERITTAVAISLTLLLTGLDLPAAVEHPRLHVELERGTVAVEPGLNPEVGRPLRHFSRRDMYFGGVTAAAWAPEGLDGYADSRRTGGVAAGGSDGSPDPRG